MSRVTLSGPPGRPITGRGIGGNTRFAMAQALTYAAKDMEAEAKRELRLNLHNPSSYTLNAFRVKPATKTDLTAALLPKDGAGKSVSAWKYLIHMETGGLRAAKRFEAALIRAGILMQGQRVVPADGGTFDVEGRNLGGRYTKLLSQLRASSDPFQNASLSNIRKGKSGRRKKSAYSAWVQRNDAGVPIAIWDRGSYSAARRDGSTVRLYGARPALLIVNGARYGDRLDIQERAEAEAKRRVPVHFGAAFTRALAGMGLPPVSRA